MYWGRVTDRPCELITPTLSLVNPYSCKGELLFLLKDENRSLSIEILDAQKAYLFRYKDAAV
jgi:hypothetical protein